MRRANRTIERKNFGRRSVVPAWAPSYRCVPSKRFTTGLSRPPPGPLPSGEGERERAGWCGGARVGIGAEVCEVQAHDGVFIPARVPHWYESIGEEAFEFLCIVPNLPDRTELVPDDDG